MNKSVKNAIIEQICREMASYTDGFYWLAIKAPKHKDYYLFVLDRLGCTVTEQDETSITFTCSVDDIKCTIDDLKEMDYPIENKDDTVDKSLYDEVVKWNDGLIESLELVRKREQHLLTEYNKLKNIQPFLWFSIILLSALLFIFMFK